MINYNNEVFIDNKEVKFKIIQIISCERKLKEQSYIDGIPTAEHNLVIGFALIEYKGGTRAIKPLVLSSDGCVEVFFGEIGMVRTKYGKVFREIEEI